MFIPGLRLSKKLRRIFREAKNKVKIIFCRGMYLAENTYQAASVEFVCHRQTNYARSRLQRLAEKPGGLFRQTKRTPRWGVLSA